LRGTGEALCFERTTGDPAELADIAAASGHIERSENRGQVRSAARAVSLVGQWAESPSKNNAFRTFRLNLQEKGGN